MTATAAGTGRPLPCLLSLSPVTLLPVLLGVVDSLEVLGVVFSVVFSVVDTVAASSFEPDPGSTPESP